MERARAYYYRKGVDMETLEIDAIRFDANGLIPAIVQDAETNRVLMLAYMNAESVRRTLQTKETHFWSRSRKEFWHKGATSGNVQKVVELRVDCDVDALLIRVNPAGPACHTGNQSCFYRTLSVEYRHVENVTYRDEAS